MSKDKDILEKYLTEFHDTFLDIVLVFMPKLRKVILNAAASGSKIELKPLRPRDFYPGLQNLQEFERDTFKELVIDGVTVHLIGIENQTAKDPSMSLRVLAYNVIGLLNWLKNHDKAVPISTTVLYYSIKQPWTKAKSLFEYLGLDEEWSQYLPDFRTEIIDLGDPDDDRSELLTSDFRLIARWIKEMRSGRPVKPYDGPLDHPEAVLYLMASILDMNPEDSDFLKRASNLLKKGDTITDMISLLTPEQQQQYIQQGKEQGFDLGKEQGQNQGIEFAKVLLKHNRMDLLDQKDLLELYSIEEIEDMLEKGKL